MKKVLPILFVSSTIAITAAGVFASNGFNINELKADTNFDTVKLVVTASDITDVTKNNNLDYDYSFKKETRWSGVYYEPVTDPEENRPNVSASTSLTMLENNHIFSGTGEVVFSMHFDFSKTHGAEKVRFVGSFVYYEEEKDHLDFYPQGEYIYQIDISDYGYSTAILDSIEIYYYC